MRKEPSLMQISVFSVHVTALHLQCGGLADRLTLNFYSARNMAVFVDNKIAYGAIISKITIFGLFCQY